MNRAVFADTFYWIALTTPTDSTHQQSLATAKRLEAERTLIVTTEEVLAEYLTYFVGRPASTRQAAVRNVERIQGHALFRVLWQSHDSFLAGFALYKARPDKGYSLTDCISMEAMRREGLTDALTNDLHFTQEGFRALFRASG